MQVVVDCEASGPCPGFGDLVQFAAVSLCGREFKSEIIMPECKFYKEEAYASFGYSREQHLKDKMSGKAIQLWLQMHYFNEWLGNEKHTFWSDNPAFDWQWINHAFHTSGFVNPFGHSARRIGDLYAGARKNWRDQSRWKKWRQTKHTHDPLEDARGNAEALNFILQKYFA